ncbi:MAG: ABC transporter permease [Planctomycetes bacterium]|nr:ABC transporter permease [Planctomycetota bacterium]
MNRHRLIVRSLLHHWRTNLAVLLGVVAGTAVIGGALIVGDSVRGSLRQMTLDRLGQIDFVVSGPRFFREELADDLESKIPGAAPAILMQAAMQAKSAGTSHRAGQVNIYGFGSGAWTLVNTEGTPPPQEAEVVLNAQVAQALHAKVGDEVTLWIELPTAVPRDTLLGHKDNDSKEIVLKVSAIATEQSGLSRLGLNPTQALPRNAFVDLRFLQERLDQEELRPTRRDPTHRPARINALLAPSPPGADPSRAGKLTDQYNAALRESIQLEDLNLRLVHDAMLNCEVLESEQMILEDKLAAAATTAAEELKLETSPVMVYLANKLVNPRLGAADLLARALKGDRQALTTLKDQAGTEPGYSMYSTMAGLDILALNGTPFGGFEFIGDKPTVLRSNDVIINEWLAADLKLKVGDPIRFAFHVVGSRGELPEEDRTGQVRGIVRMKGPAIDRSLTPQVKGITDVDSLANWEQPFTMNLDAVTSRDDAYWEEYRATPKMFLPLQSAQIMFPSRYGTLTSVRFGSKNWKPPKKLSSERTEEDSVIISRHGELSTAILKHVNPAELGLAFVPVKAIGLMAANGSTDFSGLFVGFSLFLIVAAMILIGLLFRLGIEQRVRDLGLLGAIGFTPRQVRQQMLQEGLIVVVAGGFLGLLAAIGYAELMIYGLTHWWVGAIGTRNLILCISTFSLPLAFVISIVAALASIWWALRQLNGLSLREQLAGVTEKEVDLTMQARRSHKARRRAMISAGLALLLTVGLVVGLIPAAGAFFGVGILSLVATLSYLSAWLNGAETASSLRGHGTAALGRLGLRNASRQRLRSVMTAGMIATATFLIVTVAAFRRDPTGELPDKASGNGGFTLVAESSTPVLYDLNTPEGRKQLQLTAPPDSLAAQALAAMRVVPFRVKPGEDASCLNLYQTRIPTILGIPQTLVDERRFAFAMGSWQGLAPQDTTKSDDKPSIPVLGDMNTLMFSMHKSVGQTIAIPNDEHPQHQLKIAGMFQDSIFQGVLVMNEGDFVKLYPEQKGFRYFLIEVPPELADAASSLLETELAEYGFDAEPVAERLTRFLSVQNTYLSTFQTLGGLGLLLGTLGLATVMLRNVLERQAELALLRAVGFRAAAVGTLVLLENAFVLSWGLLAGSISALLAVAPNLTSRGGDVPLGSLLILLAIVFATGMLAAAFAVRTAVHLPIVATLRGE